MKRPRRTTKVLEAWVWPRARRMMNMPALHREASKLQEVTLRDQGYEDVTTYCRVLLLASSVETTC